MKESKGFECYKCGVFYDEEFGTTIYSNGNDGGYICHSCYDDLGATDAYEEKERI